MISLYVALSFLFAYMCAAAALALLTKNNGIADIAYGGGFVLISWTTYFLGTHTSTGFLVSALATLWALRLSTRIFKRNYGKPEDFRYAAMRARWGKGVILQSFLQVFMLQGVIIFFVALPVVLVNIYDTTFVPPLLTLIGALIWLKGFFFEVVGDYQLDRFLKDPKNAGKIMDRGLWRFTRHPNYYGESLMWLGLALITLTTLGPIYGFGSTVVLFAFVSPVLITFLLLKVSGVPMLEAKLSGNPAWEAYKAKTSVFIPWFPKR